MKKIYDWHVTRYVCKRCNTPLEVESDCFHWFESIEDSAFWCPTCEDLPYAEVLGFPAEELPEELSLPNGFTCRTVPFVEPIDVKEANLLYRPYSKRSFLRQYIDWLIFSGASTSCNLASEVTVSSRFDRRTQEYTKEIEYTICDSCNDSECQFLRSGVKKPEQIRCPVIKILCDTRASHGLCQTYDEAMILKQYLIITGDEHFPMLLPQASILMGKRRPDFICYIPLSKFQYQNIVILIDRSGKSSSSVRSENAEYEKEGFIVKRIMVDPNDPGKSYFKISRQLALWLQRIPTSYVFRSIC